MTKYPILILLALSYALQGCAESTLVVGQPRAAIETEDVMIYYADRPACNFETIAHIRVDGGYYSLESMFNSMREQAAGFGASGLYVLQTQQLPLKEYLGTAKAIRCLPT